MKNSLATRLYVQGDGGTRADALTAGVRTAVNLGEGTRRLCLNFFVR